MAAWRRILLAVWLAAMGMAVHAGPDASRAPARIDLSGWDFTREGAVALDGTWSFVRGRFVGPTDPWPDAAVALQVPGSWNALGGAHGYGTYRVLVDCRADRPLAIALPFEQAAATLFVNGQVFGRQGVPGPSAAAYVPAVLHQLVPLDGVACPLELRAHVANFDLYRGGLVRSMQLGTREQLTARREQALIRSMLAFGSICTVGLLALLLATMRRRDPTALWFALLCFTYAVSVAMAGERPFQAQLADIGFTEQMRLLYVNWFGGLVFYPLLLAGLYPRQTWRTPVRVLVGFAGTGVLFALVAPVRVFTVSTPLLMGGGILVALFVFIVLGRAVLARERGALVVFAGLLALVAAAVHDIVFFQHLLEVSALPYGIAAAVLAPALLLAQRFAEALRAQELRAIEQGGKAELLVRATQAGVVDWDGTTNTNTYTDRYREILGLPVGPDAPPPPAFATMLHPADRDRIEGLVTGQLRRRHSAGLRRGEPQDFRMIRADGKVIWVHAEAIAVIGSDGRTLRYVSTLIDITPLKTAEEALAVERERLRLLVRSTRAGFSDWDAVNDRITYDERFKEMLGYPADHDTAQWPSIFDMMHPEDCDRAREEFRAMIRRKPWGGVEGAPGAPMAYRLRRSDGSWIWIHAEGISQLDDHGRTTRFITSYLDVTEFREQEEALRRQIALTQIEQRRLELVVRAARVGIVDWDGQTHATWYSPIFRQIRGYAPDADTTDWPDYFKVMIHPEDRKRITGRWVAFIRGQGPEGPRGEYYSPEEYRLLRADGSWVWVQVSGIALRDERDFVVRWIAAVIDITERRAQEEAIRESRDQVAAQAELLEKQNEALKENVRLREEVERIGRHDLKTPLNSIVAVPRLLREERKLGPEADELLGIVERAGYRILSMVNLSLDLYKMEQGTYVFRPDAVDIVDLAHKVMADVRVHAASKQVQVVLAAQQPPYAWAEELLCYSLIANLLKNAIEASPEGAHVSIVIDAVGEEAIEIRIHNEGAVPEAIRGSFFRKYATLGKASGTGLGTYSAHLMARVQDGDVSMRTSEEDGTTLTVRLRQAPAGKVPAMVRHVQERKPVEPEQLAALPPVQVLLVDDDEYNLLIVRRFLPSPPFTVDTAINGRLAIQRAEHSWPDLVFMDLDMPVMGGMEAVGRLRAIEQERGSRRTRMVALSSHDDAETKQRALDAGFDEYLTKPVTRDAIQQTLVALHRGLEQVVVVDADVSSALPGFVASRRKLLGALEAAAQRGDRGELRRIAHQLAGSFALYGFRWASERSRWLEHEYQAVPLDEAEELAREVLRHLDTVEIRVQPADA